MALPNKELCERIYQTHKDILDEIFVSVKDTAPQTTSQGSKIRSFSTTLDQLVESNIIDLTDILSAKYHGLEHVATLQKRTSDGRVVISYKGNQFDSPSSAATIITNNNLNGWNFWVVKDSQGHHKGTLAALRQKLDVLQPDPEETDD